MKIFADIFAQLGRARPRALIAGGLLVTTLGAAPSVGFFTSGRTRLAYEVFGTGATIVLLAGGPGMNPAYVRPLALMLADDHRRVVLFHQRGTGRSAAALSWRTRLNVAGAIADLESLRMHLKLQRMTLAGHSWGGMLAMAYAQKYPGHVGGLLLVDTGPMSSAAFSREDAAMEAALTPAERRTLIAAARAKDRARVEALERDADFADRANAKRLLQSIPPGAPLSYPAVSALMGPDLAKFDVVEGMRPLRAPVALVFGRRDPGFFIAEQLRRLKPHAKLVVVERVGHYPWLEDEIATAKALESGVAQLP